AAGMNDYVAKPIRVDELVAAIKRTPRRGSADLASPVPTENGPIDTSVLLRLSEGTGGDHDFVSDLIEQFLVDGAELVDAGRRGPARGARAEVRRAAHTLKSNAATFGAGTLADRSRRLEDAARQGSLEEGPQLLDALAEAFETVRTTLPDVWRGISADPSHA